MIHLFTNANSNVRVASFIKKDTNSSFTETSSTNYTSLGKTGKIKFEITGFEFRNGQSVSNARLICYFEKLLPNDTLVLKDSNNKIIDRVIVAAEQEYLEKKSSNYVSFDITKFLADRTKAGSMVPVYLTWSSTSSRTSINFISFKFLDEQNKNSETKNEYLMVSYANIEGIESHFAYDQKNLGTSGSVLVNIRQGHLIYELPLTLNNPHIQQVVPELVFNSLKNSEETKYGKGFRGPIEYTLDISSMSLGTLKLTDQTLKKSYFTKLSGDERYRLTPETTKEVYYCHADSTYIVSENDGTFTFVGGKNKMNLKKDGSQTLIKYFMFEDGTKISVDYDVNRTTSLVYPTGLKDCFIYDSSRLIKYKSERLGIETSFKYTNNQLTHVKTEKISYDFENNMSEIREAVRETRFAYVGNNLVKILNVKEKKAVQLTYSNSKVSSITECAISSSGALVSGNVDTLKYGNIYTIVKDSKQNEMYYHFDSYGSCVYTLDKNGVSNNFKFGTISVSDQNAECHKLRSKYRSQGNIPNLIYNGSFEFDDEVLTGWDIVSGQASSAILSKEGLYGENCVNIKAASNNVFIMKQDTKQHTAGTFKLTGFYKSKSDSSAASSNIVLTINYIELITKKASDYYYSGKTITQEVARVKEINVDLPSTAGQWEYFESESVYVPNDSNIEIAISCLSDISFDEIQLTKNNFLSGHNFIKNSHFENRTGGIAKAWSTTGTTASDGVVPALGLNDSTFLSRMIEGTVYKLSGTTNSKEKTIYQRVNLKGDSGERLLVSCWMYGSKTINEKLQLEVEIHYNHLKTNKLKKYIVTPSRNEEGWQVLTALLTTEYSYDYIIVKVVHNGFNSVYLDAIQLFKSKTGSTFSYDEKGNLMSAAESGSSTESSYDKNSRMTRKSCVDGQQFQYSYDENTGKLVRITDNFGNDVSFEYVAEGVIKEIKSGDQIIRTEEKKAENGFITKEDELGYKTLSAVDEFGNVTSYVDAKGCVVRKVFDINQRPVEIERTIENQIINKAELSYNSLGLIESIVCPNNTIISMVYDDFGNRLKTLVNDQCLETSAFDSPYDSLVSDIAVKGNSEVHKTIAYDSKGNIKKVIVDGNENQCLRYDEQGRLIEVEDLLQNKRSHFNYDVKGTVLSTTESNGNSISYDIDNLDNTEKEIVKLGESRVASNYVHEYEFNEADRTTFFDRLSRTYFDDIIVGDNGTKGLYGARPKTSIFRYTYDEDVKMNTTELAYAGKDLNYELTKVNSERQNSLSSGGNFNKYLWELNFKKSKTVYGWLRLIGKIQNKTILAFKGVGLSVEVIALSDTRLRLVANNISKDLILGRDRVSDWNMYSLSVFNQDGNTRVCFYLNGNLLHMITLGQEITGKITDLIIGDKKLADGQTGNYLESNETPIRIAMLSIGAYFYKKVNSKAIHDISKKFLFESNYEDAYSGVIFESLQDDSNDLISLNGSFTSLKRKTPLIAVYSDGSYKIDKSKSFEFDKELKRHVYAVFDGTLKLNDKNGCRLSYKSLMKNAKYISLKFKPVTKDDSIYIRTILSFTDNDSNEKVLLYLDKNDSLHCNINNNPLSINLKANHGEWNTLILSSTSIALNDTTCSIPSVNLSDLIANLGCSIKYATGSEVPYNYLNGYICDVLLTDNKTVMPINTGSVLNKHDSFGRKTRTSILCNGNSLCDTEYSFVQPTDADGNKIAGRTSTLVEKETNGVLGEVSYEYDGNRNITSITTVKNGNTQMDSFEYDAVERLTSSKKNNGEEVSTYSYDENGNMLVHQIKCGDTVTTSEYVYDESNKERLQSVIKDGQTTSLIYGESSLYPVKIGDKNLKWSLDQLVEVASSQIMLRNEYDYLSRRVKKITENSETDYMYDQKGLIAEITGSVKKTLIYDDKGSIVGFVKDDGVAKSTYFYVKDQLDVIKAVIDCDGNIKAHYEYDDFGLLLNSNEVDFAFNSILYKGYMYDQETKWYLLGHRYYAPELKRFISPDKVDNIIYSVADLAQFSLYAYCGNNPIMRVDSCGQNWFTNMIKKAVKAVKQVVSVVATAVCVAAGAVVGAVVGGTAALITSIKSGESFCDTVVNTIKGIGEGAEMGAEAGLAGGLILSGHIMGNDDLKALGQDVFTNVVLPKVIDFAQENIVGLMSIADGLHSIITSPVFAGLLVGSGNPIAILIGGGCVTYTFAQVATAEENYTNNVALLGEDEENLIYPTTDDNGYLKPTNTINVVVDDEVYITNQNNSFYNTIKFGVKPISSNGCEIMATYNMLRYLKRKIPFANLIYYFETKNLLFGLLGAWPTHLKELFSTLGIDCYFTYNKNDLPMFTIQNFKALIPTYFHHKYGTNVSKPSDIERYLIAHTTFMPLIENYYSKWVGNPGNYKVFSVKDKFIEINMDEVLCEKLTDLISETPQVEKRVMISVLGVE